MGAKLSALKHEKGSDGSSRSSDKNEPKFVFANGRRYHGNSACPYALPNDLAEIDRLDIQHYAIQHTTGYRYHVPLTNPKNAIDVGTGTGIWLLEMAADFPDCHFLGIDIAPLQPTTILPMNCTFELCNVLEGIPRPDNFFDYIHHRLLALAMPEDKWPFYIEECIRTCASDGWIEMVESDILLYSCNIAGKALNQLVVKSNKTRGVNTEAVRDIEKMMQKAGLADTAQAVYQIPIGSWGGKIGELYWQNYRAGVTGLSPLMAATCDVTQEEIQQLLDEVGKDIDRLQTYMLVFLYTAHKL